MGNKDEYFLVNADILPEVLLKTIEAKELISSGKVATISEGVKKVGLSRSAFYKYKDGIYPFNAMMKEKMVTIAMDLDHHSGILSKVLTRIAEQGANILTINQSIPLQGVANITLSIDTIAMIPNLTDLLDQIRSINGVKRAIVVGKG